MAFTKAKIKVYKENGTESIAVLFNPAEYNLSDNVNYAEKTIPGLDGPITQFVSGQASTLDMTLMFDTYETDGHGALLAEPQPADVTKLTRKITALAQIDGSLHRPPLCEFIWGPLQFRGVLTAVKQSFTMFMDDGMPVRAKLDVTFKSVYDPAEGRRRSPFESPDRTKYRLVTLDSDLWRIAWEEYGDPGLWRVIARANGLMDPLAVAPGRRLQLPAL
jgi:hypothetical protein